MITDFLNTNRTKEELKTALDVLLEFKKCESQEEFISCPLMAWAKLEQLEEFLKHIVDGEPLELDTIEYINRKR